MSCIYPTTHGLSNCINGNAIIVHYAFGPQRSFLEKSGILGKYASVLRQVLKEFPRLNDISQNVFALMEQADSMENKASSLRRVNHLLKGGWWRILFPKRLRRMARILLQKEPDRYIQYIHDK